MKNVIILILFMIISCNNKENEKKSSDNNFKKENSQNIKFNITKIEKHIKLQERVESDEDEYENPYELTFNDLDLCSQIIYEGLKKNGYKNISDTQFIEKINLIFNVNSKSGCDEYHYENDFITLFGYKMDGKLKTLLDNQYNTFFATKNLFISEKEHFLFQMFLLKEIIKINDDNTYSLNVPEYIIARNKYLFNDDKASLVWLKFNDQYFLESLVKVFGYVQDEDLLKWVLDRNLNDDEFDKLLLTKTCDNKFIFHKEIFEVMTKADKKSKESYLLYLRGKTELPKVDDANFSDTAKIYALYCYYATKFTQSIDQGDVYTFFPRLNEKKYEEEFRKNNYYNIPDFKELFEDTKNGGIGLPM